MQTRKQISPTIDAQTFRDSVAFLELAGRINPERPGPGRPILFSDEDAAELRIFLELVAGGRTRAAALDAMGGPQSAPADPSRHTPTYPQPVHVGPQLVPVGPSSAGEAVETGGLGTANSRRPHPLETVDAQKSAPTVPTVTTAAITAIEGERQKRETAEAVAIAETARAVDEERRRRDAEKATRAEAEARARAEAEAETARREAAAERELARGLVHRVANLERAMTEKPKGIFSRVRAAWDVLLGRRSAPLCLPAPRENAELKKAA